MSYTAENSVTVLPSRALPVSILLRWGDVDTTVSNQIDRGIPGCNTL
jgi:hypothetical protein